MWAGKKVKNIKIKLKSGFSLSFDTLFDIYTAIGRPVFPVVL